MDSQDLTNRFGFHPATEITGPLHNAVRQECLIVAERLDALVPNGREKALVMTKIEEAMMWANAAIARSQAPLGLETGVQPIKDDPQG